METAVMHLILPVLKARYGELVYPCFFLVGPIRRETDCDWERVCALEVAKQIENPWIAVPRKWPLEHELCEFLTEGIVRGFASIAQWYEHYFNQALANAKAGCVIIWIPPEENTAFHKILERGGYNQLDELVSQYGSQLGVRLVIGVDSGFNYIDELPRNLKAYLRFGYIPRTVPDVVAKAVKRCGLG